MGREPKKHLPPQGTSEDDQHRPGYSRRFITKQEFARRLDELRNKRGWSQAELARRVGMRRDAIHSYLHERHLPTPASLERLARALGTTPEALLPNHEIHALDQSERPAFAIRQAQGASDKVWLEVNQVVTPGQALRIQQILNERQGDEAGAS